MKNLFATILILITFGSPASSNETDYQKVIRSQIEAFSKDDMKAAFQFASILETLNICLMEKNRRKQYRVLVEK